MAGVQNSEVWGRIIGSAGGGNRQYGVDVDAMELLCWMRLMCACKAGNNLRAGEENT